VPVGDVVVFRWVGGDVVELPVLGIEVGERPGADQGAERLTRLSERRPGPRAHGPPAVVVDGPVAEHLVVLGAVPGRRDRIVEGVGEADAVDG
jgi:hypothetical protein